MFHRKWRPTDWRLCGSFDTYFVVVLPLSPLSTFRIFLLFLRGTALTNGFVSLSPLAKIFSLSLRLLSPLVFISPQHSNFLPLYKFVSNVFSFLLMQVFYVFLVVYRGESRRKGGWRLSCLRFPHLCNVDLRWWTAAGNSRVWERIVNIENLYGFSTHFMMLQ